MTKKRTLKIVRASIIAGLYFCLTLPGTVISYGPMQIRFSEALTILPVLFPEAIVGLTVGCLLSNIFSQFGVIDIVCGSLFTLVAAILSFVTRKNMPLSAFWPVIINALGLPVIFYFAGDETFYIINVMMIFITQTVVIYGLGLPLTKILEKRIRIDR